MTTDLVTAGGGSLVGLAQLDPLLAGGLSDHTLAARRQDAAHLLTWLGEAGLVLDGLTELDVIAFRDWCAARWAPSTVNRRLSTLRLVTRRLHKLGRIDADPAADVRGFSASVEHTPALTWAQAVRLVRACKADDGPRGVRDTALVRLGLRTALRRAEILRFRLADVTTHQGHACAWVTIKRSKRLRVKLSAVLGDLNAWRSCAALYGADLELGPVARGVVGRGPTYSILDGMAPRSFDRMVERRGVQAGIPFRVTPHVLRATFITLVLEAGAPLTRAGAAAGQSSIQTTAGYDARRGELENHPTDLLIGI